MPDKPDEKPEEYARFEDLLRKVVKPDQKSKHTTEPKAETDDPANF